MKLLELYSLSTGAKIDKPFIYKAFYPLPFEKYITIHASAGMPAKVYSFWEDVIDLILPFLKKEGIKIVQIGGKEDEKLKDCFHLQGVTNVHQTAYILSNSIAHLSNDTFSAHVAGAFDVPIITIYGSTTIQNHSPYFYNREKSTLIEADRKGFKPSYARDEKPKLIDTIDPEDIANGLLRLFDHKVNRESICFGDYYPTYIVEVVPDHAIPNEQLANGVVNVRMDYVFNEENLVKLMYSRKVNILTDKPIDLKVLKAFKSRINTFSYEVDSSTSPEYLKAAKALGINLSLFTKIQDAQELSALRIKLFDFEITQERVTKKEQFDFSTKVGENTSYKSNKFLLAKDGIFPSKAAWLKKQSIKSFEDNIQKVIDTPEFWEEIDYFYVFNN